MPDPFLKWPGGKRWLASRLVPMIETKLSGRYFEPFLGGGAVFFALRPPSAVLSDVNADLINTYVQVRDNCELLIRRLKTLPVNKRSYLAIRREEPSEPVERAVRFLYLNRTAFGGMYRVNRQGRFNVPYGGGERTPEILWTTQVLREAAATLKDAEIVASDFEAMIERAERGDVVYCDPTYTVAHENNGFVRYNERNFGWEDQRRLAAAAFRASERGVAVLLSNAYHASIRKLYPRVQNRRIERLSLVSRDVAARRAVNEYLFLL